MCALHTVLFDVCVCVCVEAMRKLYKTLSYERKQYESQTGSTDCSVAHSRTLTQLALSDNLPVSSRPLYQQGGAVSLAWPARSCSKLLVLKC